MHILRSFFRMSLLIIACCYNQLDFVEFLNCIGMWSYSSLSNTAFASKKIILQYLLVVVKKIVWLCRQKVVFFLKNYTECIFQWLNPYFLDFFWQGPFFSVQIFPDRYNVPAIRWKTALCSCIVSLKLMLVGVSSLLTGRSSLSCWSQAPSKKCLSLPVLSLLGVRR